MRIPYVSVAAVLALLALGGCQKKTDTAPGSAADSAAAAPSAMGGAASAPPQPNPNGSDATVPGGAAPGSTAPGSTASGATASGAMSSSNAPTGTGGAPPPK